MHVELRDRLLDRRDDPAVVVARERRVDAALQADLGRATLPRLLHAPHDLLVGDEVRRPAQVRGELPLRERAEAAAEVADVRVLDVPRHDVRHLVAAHLAPQPVGGGEDALPFPAAGREEPHELVLAELLSHDPQRRGVPADEERHGHRLTGRPVVLAGEALSVGRPPDRWRHRRVGPALEIRDVLRVERQARRQLEAARATRRAQTLHRGPRRLGIDVVGGHRGDASPVVDARVEQQREVVVGEVRRRLHVDPRSQHDPGDGDRPEVLLERGVRVVGHARPGLRPEVLHDHLAEVAMPLRHRPEREQRVEPLRTRLADPDQDAARERDRELPGEPHGLEPPGRFLVRGGPVRAAAAGEPPRRRLEHDPHRGGDRAQGDELLARHHAGVQVRQETGLVEHASCAPREVLERGPAPEEAELLARDAVAGLRPVAEREERLGAAGARPGPCDREHLVLAEVRPLPATWRPRERAVAAHVPAERRQRDEDLRRVRDPRAGAGRTQAPGLGHEVVERGGEKLREICHRRRLSPGGLLAPEPGA